MCRKESFGYQNTLFFWMLSIAFGSCFLQQLFSNHHFPPNLPTLYVIVSLVRTHYKMNWCRRDFKNVAMRERQLMTSDFRVGTYGVPNDPPKSDFIERKLSKSLDVIYGRSRIILYNVLYKIFYDHCFQFLHNIPVCR